MADDKKMLAHVDTGIEQRAGGPHETDMMEMFHSGKYLEIPTSALGSKWPRSENQKVVSIKSK